MPQCHGLVINFWEALCPSLLHLQARPLAFFSLVFYLSSCPRALPQNGYHPEISSFFILPDTAFSSLFLVLIHTLKKKKKNPSTLSPSPELASRPPWESSGRWVGTDSSFVAQGYFSLFKVFDFF